MADVDIKCEACGETLTVSEFVDADAIFCRKCGDKIRHSDTTAIASQRLRIRSSGATSVAPQAEEEGASTRDEWLPPASVHASSEDQRKRDQIHHIGSWILFILIGGVMGYLRYGGGASSEWRAYSLEYSWIIVIAFHILILLKASKDSIFQAILCVLIPPYSFYYILMVSDDFYMRAVIAGLLVGIGEDSFGKLNSVWLNAVDIVQRWIASGG